jgi:CRISPR/Cas system-associated endonuclease Cas3-HD
MNEELGKVALAGLLHDIGKFGQRAGEMAAGKRDHARIGEKFVSTFVPQPWQGVVSAAVAWHHGDPEGRGHEVFPVLVVRAADRLSAGEREQREEEEHGRHPPQMVSPFASLFHAHGELPQALASPGTLGLGGGKSLSQGKPLFGKRMAR